MNPVDTAAFQQAVQLAQSGQKEAAYAQLSAIARANSNYQEPDLLLWVAYTTPHREEAQQALNIISSVAPNHPGLPAARNWLEQGQAPVWQIAPGQGQAPAWQNRPAAFQCPYCHTYAPPRIERKVSTAGWIVFVILLLFTIFFCWIGLLIKEEYRVCSNCGCKLG